MKDLRKPFIADEAKEHEEMQFNQNRNVEQLEEEGSDNLNQDEIEKAQKLIDERYPLNYLRIVEVFSFLKPLTMCCKKQQKKKQSFAFKKALLSDAVKAKLGDKNQLHELGKLYKDEHKKTRRLSDVEHKEEKRMENNPLNLLGIGIVAQFNLMAYLIFAFVVFSLLSIPIIKIYSGYDAMRGTKKEIYTATTLGNFGFSSSA